MWHIIDQKVKHHLKNYLTQCALATIAVFMILMAFNLYDQAVIVAAFGSTAFAAFAMPKSWTARERNIIGGHIIGVLVGVGLAYFYRMDLSCTDFAAFNTAFHILLAALSISISMFLMVFLDFEHPPASGTALGLTISAFSVNTIIFILFVACGIALFKWLFRNYLIDLV